MDKVERLIAAANKLAEALEAKLAFDADPWSDISYVNDDEREALDTYYAVREDSA